MDSERGWIYAQPGDDVMAGLILTREDLDTVRVAVQDPKSGSVLAQTDDLPVSLSI